MQGRWWWGGGWLWRRRWWQWWWWWWWWWWCQRRRDCPIIEGLMIGNVGDDNDDDDDDDNDEFRTSKFLCTQRKVVTKKGRIWFSQAVRKGGGGGIFFSPITIKTHLIFFSLFDNKGKHLAEWKRALPIVANTSMETRKQWWKVH